MTPEDMPGPLVDIETLFPWLAAITPRRSRYGPSRSRSPPSPPRRDAKRPDGSERAHPAIGRSNSVDSTTCVCVRMIPGVSRMRSSASSRCAVSRACTCRIALASPATV